MEKDKLERLIRDCLYNGIYRKSDLEKKAYCTLLMPEERNRDLCQYAGVSRLYKLEKNGNAYEMSYCSCTKQ